MTPKQERFVQEYLIDLNAAAAYRRAGYTSGNPNINGHRLLTNAHIQAEISAAKVARSVRTEITQDWVLQKLKENTERAMQSIAVLDRDGNETGEYRYEGAVANGALGLIGKHLGMFAERIAGHDGGALKLGATVLILPDNGRGDRDAPAALPDEAPIEPG